MEAQEELKKENGKLKKRMEKMDVDRVDLLEADVDRYKEVAKSVDETNKNLRADNKHVRKVLGTVESEVTELKRERRILLAKVNKLENLEIDGENSKRMHALEMRELQLTIEQAKSANASAAVETRKKADGEIERAKTVEIKRRKDHADSVAKKRRKEKEDAKTSRQQKSFRNLQHARGRADTGYAPHGYVAAAQTPNNFHP